MALSLGTVIFLNLVAHLWATSTRLVQEGELSLPLAMAPGLLAVFSLVVGTRWAATLALSHVGWQRLRRQVSRVGAWPRVSILVPAYNEEQTVEPMLRSLLALDYPDYEVLLVDDGSSDRTFERARRFAGRHGGCQVRVYRKPNGGKWSAHNFLFHRSTAELLLCVDADSRLSPDALRRLVERMADPGVSAVAGYVRVRNRVNGLTCLQTLEYLWSGLLRLAQSASSSVLVVPGPIGLFRRAVLEEVYLNFGLGAEGTGPGEVRGPFEGTTFAEDFDLSAAILTLGGCIVYEPRAVSHTTLPASTAALLNQRYRWVRGSLQTVIKYFRRARADSRHANPSVTVWILATYVLDVVSLLFYLGALGALLAFLGRGGDPSPLLFWFVGLLALDFSTQAYLIALLQERYALLAVLPLYGLYQALLLNSALIIGCLDEIRGSRMRW